MQRDAVAGDAAVLNDDELKQRMRPQRLAVQTDNDEFDLEQSEKFESFGAVGGPVSPPPHWLERSQNVSRPGVVCDRAAERPVSANDTRRPEIQQDQRQAQQARAARLKSGIARPTLYTDRSNYDRCISLGPLGSLTPKIYNSGNRIVQGPGWVAFQQE